MAKKVFISYRHNHADWVRNTLYPVLSAGGVEITVDYKGFDAGIAVRKQMKERQSSADVHLLVLTPDYFQSDYCIEEMQRAFADDPRFEHGKVLPVILEPCELPPNIQMHNPLFVDLSGGHARDPEPWRQLMQACAADLGISVPEWISKFRRVLNNLQDQRSVNLIVSGQSKWREFIAQLKMALPGIGIVDLESGRTVRRHGLVTEILTEVAGYNARIASGEDLPTLERVLLARLPSILALKHFDLAPRRNYGDLYSALRHIVMEKRHLTLLVQSRAAFASLLPTNSVLSYLEMETVHFGP